MAVTEINTVKTSIKSIIESITSYTELKKPLEPESDGFKGASSKYGVRTLGFVEVLGTVRNVAYDVQYEVTLCKSIVKNQRDSNADDIETELLQLQANIYKEVVNTKANQPTIVLHAKEHVAAESEILDEDRLAVSKSSFVITIRVALDA